MRQSVFVAAQPGKVKRITTSCLCGWDTFQHLDTLPVFRSYPRGTFFNPQQVAPGVHPRCPACDYTKSGLKNKRGVPAEERPKAGLFEGVPRLKFFCGLRPFQLIGACAASGARSPTLGVSVALAAELSQFQ